MKRTRPTEAAPLSPEGLLQRAIAARTPVARARYAKKGLASPTHLDRVTHSMLLRQLYLALFEQHRLEKALEIANQMIALRVLPDVCHQDAARVMTLLGDTEGACDQLRLAARSAPARRRGFHLWTLGSVLFLAGRHEPAQTALLRAIRWSTTDRPLYVAHLALVRLEQNLPADDDLEATIDRLQEAPCGQGYGRFVLGLLCYHGGRRAEAEQHLRAFIKRTQSARPALAMALAGELTMAEQRLYRLTAN